MGRVKGDETNIRDYLSRLSLYAVAAGQVPGHKLVNILGRNKDVDTGPEDVWDGQDDYTGFNPVAEETLELFSANIGDTNISIKVKGLNFAGEEVEEIIITHATDGTVPVVGLVPMWRAAQAENDGSVDLIGDITIRQSVAIANIMCVMPLEANQTNICAYTIPKGKIGVVVQVTARMIRGGTGIAVIDVLARKSGKVFISTLPSSVTPAAPFDKNVAPLRLLEEKVDVKMRCLSVTTTNTDILDTIDILLMDKNLF